MNKPFLVAALAVAGSCSVLSACAPTSPRLDSRFGDSARMAIAQQTLNPVAAADSVPEVMDGAAARETVVRYRSTFKEPPPPQNVFNIGMGNNTNQ